MKRLLTPPLGVAMYASGITLLGGRDYVLVAVDDSYASNLVLNQKLQVLAVGENPVLLPDSAHLEELKNIVTEYKVSNAWDVKKETYEEYIANAYRYAAEAYTTILTGDDGHGGLSEQPVTRKSSTKNTNT